MQDEDRQPDEAEGREDVVAHEDEARQREATAEAGEAARHREEETAGGEGRAVPEDADEERLGVMRPPEGAGPG